jgi:hypothetical protein
VAEKKEDTRKKKFLNFACRDIGRSSLGLLPSVCPCGHPYVATNRFGVEIWSYSQRGYDLDKN